MPIVSSEITHDDLQIDGRRAITERHVDHLGVEYVFTYLAEAGFDVEAAMNARVPQIEAQAFMSEVSTNVAAISRYGQNATPSLSYSMPIDNGFAVMAAYESAIGFEAMMMGDYFDTLSDAQLEQIFQLPPDGSAAAFRTAKLEPASNLADALRAEAGTSGAAWLKGRK